MAMRTRSAFPLPARLFHGRDRHQHEFTSDDLSALQKDQGGYLRIPEGWIHFDPQHVEAYRQAAAGTQFPTRSIRSHCERSNPRSIAKNSCGKRGFKSSWQVTLSDAVKNAHRIADGPADVEFRIEGSSRATAARSWKCSWPVYHHDRIQLAHTGCQESPTKPLEWIRRPNCWLHVDKEKCKQIGAAMKRLKLQPGAEGYVFSGAQCEKIVEIFSPLGRIATSVSYDNFLEQLADL